MTRLHAIGSALSIVCDFCRWRIHLNPHAHFLDLRGLFFELGCESLYLFLLLRDRCFQLLNFANFAVEHGGAGRRAGVRYDAQARYEAQQVLHRPGSGQYPSQARRS
jgi:hypothetical protein